MDAIIGKMEIRDKKEEDICNFENKIKDWKFENNAQKAGTTCRNNSFKALGKMIMKMPAKTPTKMIMKMTAQMLKNICRNSHKNKCEKPQ